MFTEQRWHVAYFQGLAEGAGLTAPHDYPAWTGQHRPGNEAGVQVQPAGPTTPSLTDTKSVRAPVRHHWVVNKLGRE